MIYKHPIYNTGPSPDRDSKTETLYSYKCLLFSYLITPTDVSKYEIRNQGLF